MIDFTKGIPRKSELETWKENRKKLRRYNNIPVTTVTYLKFTDKQSVDWNRLKEIVSLDKTRYITY